MKVLKGNNIDIMSWCPDIEDSAMVQANNVANHPCVFNHVALMSDSHAGIGVPIGTVVALVDAVSPNMAGKDVGCGMRAVKTFLTDISKDELIGLKENIKNCIPVGMNTRNEVIEHKFDIDSCFNELSKYSSIFSNNYKKKVEKSIGTLGGGKMNASRPRG